MTNAHNPKQAGPQAGQTDASQASASEAGASGRGAPPAPDDFSRAPETAVFEHLERIGAAWTNAEHPPTHTVADSRLVKTDIPGAHTKNLFMKDKKGNLVLISAWADSALPLNQLHKVIGCQRLSFTGPELLWEALGVTPGSVSAFALIHDPNRRVRFVVDKALRAYDTVNFHPLRNDMTTSISLEDFDRFVASTGREAEIVDFAGLGGEAAPD